MFSRFDPTFESWVKLADICHEFHPDFSGTSFQVIFFLVKPSPIMMVSGFANNLKQLLYMVTPMLITTKQ